MARVSILIPPLIGAYDAYRDVYYFGHTFYQHLVSFNGHDLPVHLSIGPASETDFTLSLKSLDRFLKTGADHHLDIGIDAIAYAPVTMPGAFITI